MFTQCPKCETIFKLSAEVLRAAAGEVRCGRCGEIFNALARLAEEPQAFTRGESPQEQEARADNILRFVPPDQPVKRVTEEQLEFAGREGIQIAHLEIQGGDDETLPWGIGGEDDQPQETPAAAETGGEAHGEASGSPGRNAGENTVQSGGTGHDPDDDTSLEFTLPPGELDRIFIEARPRSVPRPPGAARIDVAEFEPAHPADIRNDLSDSLIDALAAPDEPASLDDSLTPRAMEMPAWAVARSATPSDAPSSVPAPIAATPSVVDAPMLATPVPPHPESLEPIRPEPQWIIEETPAAQPRKPLWIGAAIALALLLLAQIVHQNRETLAQSAGIGSALRSLYDAIGKPIRSPINLSAFEVRQWGVTGDASANGTLRVRASVINTGNQPQPYPLLRLTLADRYGTRLGSRDFLPKEYLKRDPARPLDPRERADAIVEIVDPGKTAEGFEIDVCARAADGRIACANDAAERATS